MLTVHLHTIAGLLAPPPAAKQLPVSGWLHLGLGTSLITIGVGAEWMIKKRLKNQKLWVYPMLMWTAWISAVLGGTAIGSLVPDTVGVGALGAAVVSVLGLLLLACDAADKRPDWLAFGVAIIIPGFMVATGGGLGGIFDALLKIPNSLNATIISSMFGA